MRRAFSLSLIALSLAAGAASQETLDSAERFSAIGKRQFGEGDFEAAVFSFDSAIRKLSSEPSRKQALVEAYLYLGASYVGLDHEDAAKGKFREALLLDPRLRIAPDQFPPKVTKIFDEQLLKQTAAGQKRGARKFLILGGLAAAGGVGIAASNRGSAAPGNRSPSATISVLPAGTAIAEVTILSLTASASDPDGDPVSYQWEFGDGTTAAGSAVTHVFRSERCFEVRLSVEDGRGGRTGTVTRVPVETLNGLWEVGVLPGVNAFIRCTQGGTSLACPPASARDTRLLGIQRAEGTLADPRRLDFQVLNTPRGKNPNPQPWLCRGDVAGDLRSLECRGTTDQGFSSGFGGFRPRGYQSSGSCR